MSDIVSEANGKVHGSQSHIVTAANNNSISLVVYYEVPQEYHKEILQNFKGKALKITIEEAIW